MVSGLNNGQNILYLLKDIYKLTTSMNQMNGLKGLKVLMYLANNDKYGDSLFNHHIIPYRP